MHKYFKFQKFKFEHKIENLKNIKIFKKHLFICTNKVVYIKLEYINLHL